VELNEAFALLAAQTVMPLKICLFIDDGDEYEYDGDHASLAGIYAASKMSPGSGHGNGSVLWPAGDVTRPTTEIIDTEGVHSLHKSVLDFLDNADGWADARSSAPLSSEGWWLRHSTCPKTMESFSGLSIAEQNGPP
jgi:hypothetical protein